MEFNYLLFCLSIDLFDANDFKSNLTQMVIWSENVFKVACRVRVAYLTIFSKFF